MIAIFPGSFDPPTIGHISLIKRAAAVFDKVVVAAAINDKCMFGLGTRVSMLDACCNSLTNVEVTRLDGLLADFARLHDANVIIRGLRSAHDVSYEHSMAATNRIIGDGLETLLLSALPEYSHISSSLVKDILRNNSDVSSFLPQEVIDLLNANGS